MALINCPECGKEVSDKANLCPNCGYPINDITIQDETLLFDVICTGVESTGLYENRPAIKTLVNIFGFSFSEIGKMFVSGAKFPYVLCEGISKDRADYVKSQLLAYCNIDIVLSNSKKNNDLVIDNYRQYITAPVTCPRCGSTAITTGERGFSFITGFLGSGKTTNRCGKCGWSWQP